LASRIRTWTSLLEAEGAATAAFIHRANPGGVATSAWKNEIANAALVETQTKAGYRCFEGEGRDPQGRWRPERSALVVGIPRAEAETVGRTFAGRTRSCLSSAVARPSCDPRDLSVPPPLRLVLDTNVWLDWLVFDDPSIAAIKAAVETKRAEIFIDAACEGRARAGGSGTTWERSARSMPRAGAPASPSAGG